MNQVKTKGSMRAKAKIAPFLRKIKNSPFNEIKFEDLKISTATIDIRLVEDAGIKFDKLIDILPVVPLEVQDDVEAKWPAGTITGLVCGIKNRGYIPTCKQNEDGTLEKKGFKNSTMLWMWLNDKRINIKISNNSLHMTGCKKIDHAVEAARYIQEHLQYLRSEGHEIYVNFPYMIRIDICMINYNFSLGVAIDLQSLDIFLDKNYPDFAYSPFDANICNDTLPLKVPRLATTYTIHDNGRVSMCTNEQDVGVAETNMKLAFESFLMIIEDYRKYITEAAK